MTQPQPIDIPGAAPVSATEAKATSTTTAPKIKKGRGRAQSFAYNRLDADGNVHALPPDSLPSKAPKSPVLSSPISAAGSGSGSILSLLGLSPKSSTSNSTQLPFSSTAYATSAPAYAVAQSPASSVSTSDEPELRTPPPQLYQDQSLDDTKGINSQSILELDEDLFDENSTEVPSYRRAARAHHGRSASLGASSFGRKSSYPGITPEDDSSATIPGDGSSSVASWLKSQAAGSSSPTSATYNPRDSGFREVSSNPVGLFRRLSLSSRRPVPVAPPSTSSEVSDVSDRLGRAADKGPTPAPRRLSPMGKRMLLAHYHDFS